MKTRLIFSMLSTVALLLFIVALPYSCTNSDNQKTGNAETDQVVTDTTSDVTADIQTKETSGLTTDVSGEPKNQSIATEGIMSEPAANQGLANAKPQTPQKNTNPKPAEKPVVKLPQTKESALAPKTNTVTQEEKPVEKVVAPEPAKNIEPVPKKPASETSVPKPENTQPPVEAPETKKDEDVKNEPSPKPAPPAPAPKSGDWTAPASAKSVKNPVAVDAASLAAGKKGFEKECLSCHGKKGKGDGPSAATLEKAPASLLSESVGSQTDGEIFWKITEGKKPMSSAKKSLTEEQRWQVVNYVRQLAANAKKKGHH
jgi:mono/diheme cytochrome c family protein